MNIFYDFLDSNKNYDRLRDSIKENKTPVLATGVVDGQKTHLIAGITNDVHKSNLVITHSELKAKEIYNDLKFFLKDKVVLYPAKDIIFYWADVKSMDIIKERFNIISRLINNEEITVVVTVEALFDRLVPKNIFEDFVFDIKVGDTYDIDELCKKLVFMGYEHSDVVEGQGQFARRGGIVDIYSAVNENPIRLDFFDEDVDAIKTLDAKTQRSLGNISEAKIYPMRELVYNEEQVEIAIKNIEKDLNSFKNKTDKIKMLTDEVIEKLREQKSFSGVDRYIQYFYDKTASLIDYFPKDSCFYIDEPNRVREHGDFIIREFTNSIENRIDKGYMLPKQIELVFSYDDLLKQLNKKNTVLLSNITYTLKDYKPKELVEFAVRSTSIAKNDPDMMAEDLIYMCQRQYKIIFLAGGHTRSERILKELLDRNVNAVYVENIDGVELSAGIVYITRGSLTHGFEYPEDKLAIVSDNELFTQEKKKKKKKKSKNGKPIESFTDLKVGDYVVHENHGIGVYRGIEQIIADGVSKDYMKVGYANDGVIYVSIDQMSLVQKYIGGDAAKPKLNKLGTVSWEKAKTKARNAVKILAQDLVDLYAQRQSARGYQYSADTVWQNEFEEAFPYEETDDQLNAIADCKRDMESGKVMDRLVCGDVGFGKTEVAIRAAFKTVQDGKQVAFLVPTTILAKQHYSTFASRMADFPINVDMLSRFRTPKQQRETIAGIENGSVDIVVGTHRLLSKDIKFKDLGMVIVDEEQRFGVAHKEKLKALRKNVNVLTLSATPIPRTLHMSMTGIRDMSLLEEAPNDRLPIQTYVMEYNPEFVKDAILRELARNGQVYYLYNRVSNIDEVAAQIQALVPEANVGFAHGQMSERELENIMMEFLDNEINVLVCTTIIETGLDISNANTIIIQDADCMGLSQLYQLRGRVGRSTRTSYAYLMYRQDKVLHEVSEKRLQTIKEFTEFGSGFKIAMRDLEIRGAGNLLGAEQHGHMDTVGYEMYCKLLDEAVRELKGEKIEEDFETLIEIKINAYIPNSYISSEFQKLEMYKKISLINNENDYYDVQDELLDRYGDLPRAVQNLLDIAIVKAGVHTLGGTSIAQRNGKVLIKFRQKNSVNAEKTMALVAESKGKIMVTSAGGDTTLSYTIKNENNILSEIKDLVKQIM